MVLRFVSNTSNRTRGYTHFDCLGRIVLFDRSVIKAISKESGSYERKELYRISRIETMVEICNSQRTSSFGRGKV